MKIADKVRNIFPAEKEIPKAAAVRPLEQKEYLLDGKLKRWRGPAQKVFSPVSVHLGKKGLERKYLGSYPLMTEKEALDALNAAVNAYDEGKGSWPTSTVEERIARVEDFVYRMRERRTAVVKLLMWEIGKSLEDSEKEFDRTVDYIVDTINALKDLDRTSSRFSITQGVIAQIKRAPLGVALCMGPYNYPLNETFTTLIPAILMGNTVVFKPPKYGVLLHRPLLEAFRDSFPKGVVNTLYGAGRRIIGPIMKTGKVDVLAFIGSSKVADILKQQHPKPHRLRCVLGLDAKNAGIVLPDADIDLAVGESLTGALSYNGQRCTALKILFVHRSIRSEFLKKLITGIDGIKTGMPWEPGVKITPLPEDEKIPYLAGVIADAKKHGAKVINESGGLTNGNFVYPAVVYPVNKRMRLWREEQFGPVIPVAPFDDIKEPLKYVVDSDFGQQVSVFGADMNKIAPMLDTLVNQVCRVNINSQCQRGPDIFPFTGRKDSAEGTLSVSDALRVFSIRTLVAAKDSSANKKLIRSIIRGRKSKFLSTDFIL
ncbi:MAG: aldehyde dehydrogenase [Elusimicrobia bacterium RIFOXYA12_FULL_51_18]|nr:MAG: aldehyde dehydrogenase [Elusimicrobia bacterium RIFOXYA12_FULL_51_18]OGS31926.1 MAG: aldehyde dehydrogenase [Elusimicrobia bacterium RIFOXYA2_FULL_53_38]